MDEEQVTEVDDTLCAEHRDGKPGEPHEWRRGRRGHTRVVTCTPDAPRDHAAEALAEHRSLGPAAIRWSLEEFDWRRWWRCSCGHEERTDRADPYWFENHLAAALRDKGWRSPEEYAAVEAERDAAQSATWVGWELKVRQVEAERDALRARVAAVLDEMEADAVALESQRAFIAAENVRLCATRLRAALTEQAER